MSGSRASGRLRLVTVAAAGVLLLAGCGASGSGSASRTRAETQDAPSAASPSATPQHVDHHADHEADHDAAAPVRHVALRAGERRRTVRMPASYTPSAPTGVGTDDYRCFLLDPEVVSEEMITGFNVLPGNPDVVHHVILFRVPQEQVAEAEAEDAATPGQGWTCFGDSGIGAGAGQQVDDAPWLGAWAPGGREQVYSRGFGEPFGAGSRIVMQVHYNLLVGTRPDRSAAELRLTPASSAITPLVTQLLPAPVELPCRPDHGGNRLCDRAAAVSDVKARFGAGPGATADLLHLLCGAGRPGEVQSCTRTIQQPETIRGVAGHMHLLGRSISVEVNAGKPDARTILDLPVWDFDNQGSHPVRPVRLTPGDTVTVTCRHSQELRDRLPAFEGQPDKYVVWGEGTTDEMCLGILLVTRP
jgi:hypothetical protein